MAPSPATPSSRSPHLCVRSSEEEESATALKAVPGFHTLFRLIIHISNASSGISVLEQVE